jgi:uncharacterized protein YcbK (DUF882 family)
LKAHAVVVVVVVALGASARADAPSKKDLARSAKSATHGAPPAPGTKPRPLVNMYNQWTHEWLAVDATGALPPRAVLDGFLRDHFTNKSTTMDPKLVEVALAAAKHFRSDRVDVVSGFRHPKYNLMLRKKGHQVARDSQHTHGNALDFFVPNVPTLALHAWAKQQQTGGLGLYLESGFVHVDTGPVRYWSGD